MNNVRSAIISTQPSYVLYYFTAGSPISAQVRFCSNALIFAVLITEIVEMDLPEVHR